MDNSKMNNKTAIVLGGTGLVGSNLLRILEREGEYQEVRYLGRSPLSTQNVGIKSFIGSLTNENFVKGNCVGDDIFYCLGSTKKKAGGAKEFSLMEQALSKTIFRAAKANGVQRIFLVSSIMADVLPFGSYLLTKNKIEKLAKKLWPEGCMIFRPSLLIGPRREHRILEGLLGSLLESSIIPIDIRPISGEKVARSLSYFAKNSGGNLEVNNRMMHQVARE